jgi:hypothetical protein
VGDVIEQILRHCGLWEGPLRTSTGARSPPHSSDRASAQHDLDFIPDLEYQPCERIESDGRESPAEATRELQLVLDPEFL